MRTLSLTMPAALLLLLCLACNHSAKYKPATSSEAGKNKDYKESGFKAENTPLEDKEFISSSSADSTGVAANFLSSEGSLSDQQEQFQSATPEAPAGEQHTPTPKTPKQVSPAAIAPPTAAASSDWDKKIVKTANLKVEVKNFRSFNDGLHRAIRQSGGYIAQEEQNQSAYQIENTVTIKVPVDRFEEALSQLASDSDKLVEKKITAEDVTMEMVDTRSRLETKKEVRERYLDLLKQARNMKDILAVQNEINDIQEQMEGAAGRMAYLGHSAAYSTIHLNFYQVLDAAAKSEPDAGFLYRIKGALGDGWRWISTLLIGLVTLWPLWIAAGLVWVGAKKGLAVFRNRSAIGSPQVATSSADAASVKE